MNYFIFVSVFFINLICFSYSSYPFNNESCYKNFCFVDLGGYEGSQIKSKNCPSPYKPLEFLNNKSWQTFIGLVEEKENLKNKNFYLNLVKYKDWRWINGVKLKTNSKFIYINKNIYNRVACIKNNFFYAKTLLNVSNKWICQEEGCNEDDDSCYEVVDGGGNWKTWYEAMNDCVEKRKKLAIFKNNQIPQKISTKINQPTNQVDGCYWIGLSRNTSKWKNSNQMVTFNKWKDGYINKTINKCPLVNTTSLFWFSFNCSKVYINLMCMRERTNFSNIISRTTIKNNNDNNNKNNNNNNNHQHHDKYKSSQKTKIGLGVGLTIAILFLLILFFLLFYFFNKKRKNTEELSQELGHSDTLPVEKPIYVEVVEEKNTNKNDLNLPTSNLTYVNPSDLIKGE